MSPPIEKSQRDGFHVDAFVSFHNNLGDILGGKSGWISERHVLFLELEDSVYELLCWYQSVYQIFLQ